LFLTSPNVLFDYHIYNKFFEKSALCLGKILSLLKTPKTSHYWGGSMLTFFLKLPCRPVGTKDNETLRTRMNKLGILLPETEESD